MAAAGLIGIASVVLPWVQQEGFSMSGLDRGGWPMILMGTAYLVVGLIGVDTVASLRTLVGASLVGLLTVGLGLRGVFQDESSVGIGLTLAAITSVASLGIIWRMRNR